MCKGRHSPSSWAVRKVYLVERAVHVVQLITNQWLQKVKNLIGNIVKSQNIVEQANSNSNNTSLTIGRQLIILNASVSTEVNQEQHS